MTIDEAIAALQAKIAGVSQEALTRVVRVSEEEARVSVYAPAEHLESIQNATRDQTIQLLTEGLDVQVFVYDKATTKIPD